MDSASFIYFISVFKICLCLVHYIGRSFISAETSSVDLSKEGSLTSKDGEDEESGDKKDDKKAAVKVSVIPLSVCLFVCVVCINLLSFVFFKRCSLYFFSRHHHV